MRTSILIMATVVGVLVEVPVMLLLVKVVNTTSTSFAHNQDGSCCPANTILKKDTAEGVI